MDAGHGKEENSANGNTAVIQQRNPQNNAESLDKNSRFSDGQQNQNSGVFQRRNKNRNRGPNQQNSKLDQGNQDNNNANRGNGPRGPKNIRDGGNQRNDDFFIGRRLAELQGPTYDLPDMQNEDIKFSGRNRLYVGNLTNDVTDDDLVEMFKPYGEISETFLNAEKNFAFLKVDFHSNAEKAKRELDGTQRKGRSVRVRFAPNSTILRVKNLTQFVSNELLYKSFEVFGPLERAVVICDDRGKHTGEGIIEFVKKSSAMACLRMCNDRCFFLTASLRPVILEPLEMNDEIDGLTEKMINKKTQEFHHERALGPRFADISSFEHEFGTRWKQLHELYRTKFDALKRELSLEEEKLNAQMDFARYEHETEKLRQELRKREQDNERKKKEWELREKQAEEQRLRVGEQMRRTANEMQLSMNRQDDEMRRRQQESTLFMQAQQLNSFLDQHDVGNASNNAGGNGANQGQGFDFRGGNNMNIGNNQQDGMNQLNPFNNQGSNGNVGLPQRNNNMANNRPWERRDDFQNKRRRF